LALVACTKKPAARKPDLATHAKHPARVIASHPLAAAPTIAERVGTTPQLLIDYLAEENLLQDFAQQPRIHALSSDEARVVNDALKALPPPVARLAAQSVAAIYFVEDLGGSGWTDALRDDAQERRSIMVFDASVLDRRLNEWATDKERTVFALGADVRIILASDESNTPGSAFRFILLHELGHAIGNRLLVHPLHDDAALFETEFTKISWRIDAKMFVPQRPLWPQRLGFYGTAVPLPASDAPVLEAALKQSEYASLYSSVRIEDDFAESFALYVHIVMMNQPHIAIVSGDNHLITCLESSRCKEKRAFVGKLLR
jgi:hypothetical protein